MNSNLIIKISYFYALCLLSACGGVAYQFPKVAERVRAQALPQLEGPVWLIAEEVLTCEPPVVAEPESQEVGGERSKLPVTFLLDPDQLSRSELLQEGIKRWSAWMEKNDATFAMQFDLPIKNAQDLELKRESFEKQLRAISGREVIDTPRAWYDRGAHLEIEQAFRGGWLPLNVIINPISVHVIGMLGMGVPAQKARCDSLLKQFRLPEDEGVRPKPIWQAMRSISEPGARLIKAPRPTITEACLELFDLPLGLRSIDQGDQGETADRWHLVIKTQKKNSRRHADQLPDSTHTSRAIGSPR